MDADREELKIRLSHTPTPELLGVFERAIGHTADGIEASARLLAPEVESQIRRSLETSMTQKMASFGFRPYALPPLTRRQRLIARYRDWKWRISKAWDHLRGIECDREDW